MKLRRVQIILDGTGCSHLPSARENLTKVMLCFFPPGAGDVSQDQGSKPRVLVTPSSGVTSLHLRHSPRATHLFITTRTHTYCVNCTLRDKETTVGV